MTSIQKHVDFYSWLNRSNQVANIQRATGIFVHVGARHAMLGRRALFLLFVIGSGVYAGGLNRGRRNRPCVRETGLLGMQSKGFYAASYYI